MTSLRLILASLLHHWRMNLAVAAGTAVGAAVLTGALLIGDSMQGSLRHLTLDRLGRIDDVWVTDQFFREELAGESGKEAAPAILLRASLERADSDPAIRANAIELIGCDERFWRLGTGGPVGLPGRSEIVLNRPLAHQLGVTTGDDVLLYLPRPGPIPAESPLGQKEAVRTLRLRVSQVIPAEGLGRFGLQPSQRLPRNAYISLRSLQEDLDEPGRVNAILAVGGGQWRPRLSDCGINVRKTPQGYIDLSPERMILTRAAEKAILERLPKADVQPALTYLANTISCGKRSLPYSTITAIDFVSEPPLGPFIGQDGNPVAPLADNQIALNTWAADDLGAKLGDTIRVVYFEPESTHGVIRERVAEFRLAAVLPLAGAANDRAMTPSVRGMTDKLSMSNWDPALPVRCSARAAEG